VKLWPWKGSTTSAREAWRELAGTGQPPARTAAAVGLGLAIGLLPIMPFQTAAALGAAFLLRLNRLAVWLPTLVWQPFTAPAIVAAEVWVGRALTGAEGPAGTAGSLWARWGWPLIVGSGVVAGGAGFLAGGVAYLLLKRNSRQDDAPSVLEREEG
jgi:uncharacterized protein (DUF2062 family)